MKCHKTTCRIRHWATATEHYALVDEILYHLEPHKSQLRWIGIGSFWKYMDREKFLLEAHFGPFGGYLGDAKIHRHLSQHYWWLRMWQDITHWTWRCMTCAMRSVHQPFRLQSQLVQLLIALWVDVLPLPLTQQRESTRSCFHELPNQMARGVCSVWTDDLDYSLFAS